MEERVEAATKFKTRGTDLLTVRYSNTHQGRTVRGV